jgi:hypothetical protein
MTGELKLGNAATGILVYAIVPATITASDNNTVITGRRIHNSEIVIENSLLG